MSPEIPAVKLELDPSLYAPTDEERAFYKSQTGIASDEELKEHIIAVQQQAYKVYPYPCIWAFTFTKLIISLLPAYPRALALGKERKGAIFLDLACCFGNDIRKAVADGFPAKQAIASDYRGDFWQLGHELFKSTLESFPVAFVAGDAFDDHFISPAPVVYAKPTTPVPMLPSLTSLAPLHGQVAAIHMSSFFHLFTEEKQRELAKRVGALLSPEPGSIIFGAHIGGKEKGDLVNSQSYRVVLHEANMFGHSPESWEALWDGDVFKKGSVKVEASLSKASLGKWNADMLVWSVTRL